MKKISFKKFFTLIELIVVIVVLGILAAIVIPNISSFKEEAKETAMISDGRNIQTAIDLYQLDNNGDYPIVSENKPTLGKPADVDFNLLKPEYLRDLPQHNGMYYQVDYQGQLHFSMIDNPTDFEKKATSLTWTPNDKATGYDIHEVASVTTSASNGTKIKLVANNVQGGTFTPEGYNHGNTYFINVIDQHGFKAAPVFEGYTGSVPFKRDDIKGVTPPPTNETPIKESELDQLVLGDFVQFGKHLNGDSMNWNVVKKENGEVMLFMTEPIKGVNGSYVKRSYDVAPSDGEKTDTGRINLGSNNWKYSDLRIWLNGDFYNNSIEKKSIISETSHDYILAAIDSDKATSGNETHTPTYRIPSEALKNYQNAYKNTVSDKVFLVNIEELITIAEVIGNSYYSNPNSPHWYWTRDSFASSSSAMRNVTSSGTISLINANVNQGHIRAALVLDSGIITTGDGSINLPYIIE